MASLVKLKEGPNFVVYKIEGSEQKLIRLMGVRFSYPHFGTAREDEDESGNKKKAWNGVAMLPKATHVAAKDAFMELVNELQKVNDVKVPPEYRCIKNGDDKEDEAMAGHWLISFSEGAEAKGKARMRPPARNKTNQIIDSVEKIDEIFYGGAWGEVLLRPWYFNGKSAKSAKTYPKRICCGYNGVKFTKDDTPFGNGRIDDSDVWGEADADDGMGGGSGSTNDDGL